MDAGSSASGRPPVVAAVAAAEDTMAVAAVAVQEGARLERTLRKRMAWCGAHFTSGSGSFFTSGSGSQVYNLSAYYSAVQYACVSDSLVKHSPKNRPKTPDDEKRIIFSAPHLH